MNRPVHWLATAICYAWMTCFLVPFFVLGCLWVWACAGFKLGVDIGGPVRKRILKLGEAK